MVNQNKVCQGEKLSPVRTRFDYKKRAGQGYEQGVSVELCPLFDFSLEPWMLLRHMHRTLILAHQVVRFTKVDKIKNKPISVLDVGCGYCEQFTLLSRIRKAAGSKISYTGVDIDKDKEKIAKELRPRVNYHVMDMLDIDQLEEGPFDAIICGETIEHVEEEKGISLLHAMYDVLKPDGILIMSFPTPMSETHRDNPFHVRLWDLNEVWNIAEQIGFEVLDGFHLGIYKKNFPEQSDRLPVEMFRTAMSALVGDKYVGPDAIFVAKKVYNYDGY